MNPSQPTTNILIIDDNRLLSPSLRDYLQHSGIGATCLFEGNQAAGWLEENSCDAIVMDLKMPDCDGIALTEMIREKHPELPILIWTGLGYDELRIEEARAAGANGFLSKVMGPKLILMTLLQLVGERHEESELVAA